MALVASSHDGGRSISVVDLDKVREQHDRSKNRNKESLLKAQETRKRQKEIADIFIEVYREIFDSTYTMRKARWHTLKGKRKRIDSDKTRLWAMFKKAEISYGSDYTRFKNYIRYALRGASNASFVVSSAQAFGFVVSDKVFDQYYFQTKKKSFSTGHTNVKVTSMEEKHALLFKK